MPAPAQSVGVSTFDIAGGLAALCVVALVLVPAQGLPDLAAGLREIVQSFAVPALLVICGIRASAQAGNDWLDTVAGAIASFAFALLAWGAVLTVMGLTLGGWDGAQALLHAQLKNVSLLLLVPFFILLSKLLAFLRPASVLFLAAAAEVLHTNMGHFLVVEALRGAVFFFAGYYFARQAQDYAKFAQNRPWYAMTGVAIWLAFLAFIAFANHPLAHGHDITTLPFTSLGLGAAGAIALIMIAQLLQAAPSGSWLATAGRNWISIYTAAALIAFAWSGLLAWNGSLSLSMEAMMATALALIAVIALGVAIAPRNTDKSPSAKQRTSGMYVRQ